MESDNRGYHQTLTTPYLVQYQSRTHDEQYIHLILYFNDVYQVQYKAIFLVTSQSMALFNGQPRFSHPTVIDIPIQMNTGNDPCLKGPRPAREGTVLNI